AGRRGIGDPGAAGAFAAETIARLVAEGRLMQDVFTSYPGSYQSGKRQIDASEVVLHNNAERGWWMVVEGRVYDVTAFAALHPGGPRIVRAYAGLDATHAYRAVLHDRNPEVDAQLAMHEIGVIRRLDFASAWGVAIGERGLYSVSVADAFRVWLRYLNLIVEMENALANDVDFLTRPLTDREDGRELTPQKAQLALDTHRRFFTIYLGGLTGDDLQRLWSVTSGLCRPDADLRALRARLDEVEAGEEARIVHEAPEMIWRSLADHVRVDGSIDVLDRLCDLLDRHDRQLLADLKAVVRDGVMVFEEHEQRAVAAGGERLFEAVSAIPATVERY
ncbi:MAG: cytochrome b5 domain-containing protein, partial [Vicinamibacterales bacterium]